MKKIILVCLILVQAVMLLAVFDDYQPSARARAMGNAYSAISDDANGLFYNPAGLGGYKYAVAAGYANLYGQDFSEFKTVALAAQLPANLGTVALGARMMDVNYEDVNLMSEQIITLGHSLQLMKDIHSQINFGYSANLYKLAMDGETDDSAFGVDLGLVALLHDRTKFGFAVNNLTKARMGYENQIDLPSSLSLGISYLPYDMVTTSIELKKDFGKETEFMGGVEARPFTPLAIRFGVHQNPATYNAGMGLYIKNVILDYAYTYHPVLDGTHYINLGYKF